MDPHTKSRTTSTNVFSSYVNNCCPEDLPRAMNDREEWRRGSYPCASTIWWWWKWVDEEICIFLNSFIYFVLTHVYVSILLLSTWTHSRLQFLFVFFLRIPILYLLVLLGILSGVAEKIQQRELRNPKKHNNEKPLAYVVTYNKNNPELFREIMKNLEELKNKYKIKEIFDTTKSIKCQRQSKNLKIISTSSTFGDNTT